MAQRPISLNGYSWVEGQVVNAVDPSGMIYEQPYQYAGCLDQMGQVGNCIHSLPVESFLYPDVLPESTKLGAGEFAEYGFMWTELGLETSLPTLLYSIGVEAAFSIGARILDTFGYHIAAENMWHYLGGTGEAKIINVNKALSDVPTVNQEATQTFNSQVLPLISQAVRDEFLGDGCLYFQFTPSNPRFGGWFVSTEFGNAVGSSGNTTIRDYYLAIGEFHYGFSGSVTARRTHSSILVDVCYVVNMFDRYDWEPGFAANILGQEVPNELAGSLHLLGTARAFELYGISSYRCLQYHMSIL